MPRILQALVGLGLLIGLGFVTRPYFKQWLETSIKEGEAASAKEREKWKPVTGNFGDVKFDQPIIIMPPTYDPSRRPTMPGRR
jgi:hypothetical protein